ncbi:hypothetical protein BJ944DRAFT_259342 [Cunninghamella echinulata]|nr:hypothetical protein BJ944DRAFT_259342 [Cunninghamella echinulata]
MNKKPNTDISKTRTFSRHEKEMGLHLLTLPKASVNVISQMVPYESSHLYPKLAGANWTCYITNDIVRLGRVPTENKPANNKRLIDVDFGANKQISRRHADIKYNSRKNYWELRVYGKIGVKVNHRLVTKKDRPVPLTTMAYLDIGGNEFIFILPEVTDIKPNKSRVTTVPEPNDDNKNDTNNTNNNNNDNMEASLDNEQDHQLLAFIVEVFESSNNKDLSTEQIFKKVLDQCRKQSIDTDQYTMVIIFMQYPHTYIYIHTYLYICIYFKSRSNSKKKIRVSLLGYDFKDSGY